MCFEITNCAASSLPFIYCITLHYNFIHEYAQISLFSVAIHHYSDAIMGTIASQITSVSIAYSAVCSDPDQRKHQSSASLAFVRGIHRLPVNSPHKGQVTRKMFPFDYVIMPHVFTLWPTNTIPEINLDNTSYVRTWHTSIYDNTTPYIDNFIYVHQPSSVLYPTYVLNNDWQEFYFWI